MKVRLCYAFVPFLSALIYILHLCVALRCVALRYVYSAYFCLCFLEDRKVGKVDGVVGWWD